MLIDDGRRGLFPNASGEDRRETYKRAQTGTKPSDKNERYLSVVSRLLQRT